MSKHPSSRYEWERIVRRYPLAPVPKLVAFAMATYADQDGSRIYPGVIRLAAVTGLSERSVRNALGVLRNSGLVERSSQGGRRGMSAHADVYRLTIPEDLLEVVELLPPDEQPAPNRHVVPPGNVPNRHVVPPQPAGGAAQPASDDTPTGTTCTPPVVLPTTHQHNHQREDHLREVTTGRARAEMSNVVRVDKWGGDVA